MRLILGAAYNLEIAVVSYAGRIRLDEFVHLFDLVIWHRFLIPCRLARDIFRDCL